MFEQYGYAQARLALIAAGAGVSTGALHFRFENKAAVAAAVEAEASHAARRLPWRLPQEDHRAAGPHGHVARPGPPAAPGHRHAGRFPAQR
ncbi:TetR/AcrR family transcriptional regulator [Streptomyces thinghirensis]|nr:TetR/AcrR family transcriptional regulator [Streptomyces thinghirensis]